MLSKKIMISCANGKEAQAIGDALMLRGFYHGDDQSETICPYEYFTSHYDRNTTGATINVWPGLKRFNGNGVPLPSATHTYLEFMALLAPNAD